MITQVMVHLPGRLVSSCWRRQSGCCSPDFSSCALLWIPFEAFVLRRIGQIIEIFALVNFFSRGSAVGFNLLLCFLFQPSEPNTYADIDAAYKCLEKYGIRDENIVLYGQSVGSGPTVDLATRLPALRGVVLHSPILSGLRVMYPVKRTYWFDIYKVYLRSHSSRKPYCSSQIFPLSLVIFVHREAVGNIILQPGCLCHRLCILMFLLDI